MVLTVALLALDITNCESQIVNSYPSATLLDDNKQTIVIKVGYPARLELRGRPFRETQPYNNDKAEINPSSADKIGPDVRHELEVCWIIIIENDARYNIF